MRKIIIDSCGDIYDVEMINLKVLRSILNFEEEAEVIYEKLKFMINMKKFSRKQSEKEEEDCQTIDIKYGLVVISSEPISYKNIILINDQL